MQIFFTIFGGPHDGYKFSLGIPRDYIHLIERSPEAAVRRSGNPVYKEQVKTVQYAKRRVFVKKYGKVFFKDVYAFDEYDFREALKEFKHYFNPVYKKQDHLRVVF
ncbi:TPA: hypothetical protein R7O42_000610 [Acinetobacter baumannii]|uniref:hypothetical protein n=1 Tax=Acinetobacter baumannii TaxID=470 RepID=UPI00233F9CB6|nr:hypothetical protein [Acinetobacter baumannii]HEE5399791.1 hypothetical protein [Acinetobacter baumannii]